MPDLHINQQVKPGINETVWNIETSVFTAKEDSTDIQIKWQSAVPGVPSSDTQSVKLAEWQKAELAKDSIAGIN